MSKKYVVQLGLVALFVASLHAGEIQTGKGTFELTGGFIGLDQSLKADINTYSLVEQHKNIFSSNWFYKYNFTWYDSKNMVQAQNTINGYLGNNPLLPPGMPVVPSIDYRFQGLDLNVVLGRDLLHNDEQNYLGFGLLVGLSTPWIDSKKDSNNNDSSSDSAMNAMKKSKTKILTYKVGISLSASKSLNDYFSLYAKGNVAYQTGSIKNDYANADLSVNGIFQEYDAGIKFQPFSEDYKLGWFTLSPRLYATLGYRYSSWKMNDVNIDITGLNTQFTQTDLKMNASVGYFGLGYSF